MGDILDAFTNTIGGAIGATASGILGLPLQSLQNDMQANQQERLMRQQIEGQKELSAYNMQLQQQMWDNTNYEAQVKHLEAAGLNPALLYAKGGGGGATTGSASGSVGMGMATNGQTAMNAIATAEAQADIKLKEAQANRINAETPNVDDTMKAQINSLNQGTESQKAQQALTQAQTQLQNLQNQIAGETIDDQVATIRANAGMIENNMQRAARDNATEQATMNDRIKTAKGIMLQQYLQNNLTKAATSNIQADTKLKGTQNDLTYQQIKASVNSIMQQWDQLGNNTEMNTKMIEKITQELRLNDLPESTKVIAGLTKLITILKGNQ